MKEVYTNSIASGNKLISILPIQTSRDYASAYVPLEVSTGNVQHDIFAYAFTLIYFFGHCINFCYSVIGA